MGFNEFVTLFFIVAAVVIFFQLRSVLGRRTGNEKPPGTIYGSSREAAPAPDDVDAGKVVTLPRRDVDETERFAAIDAFAPPDTPLNGQLREVSKIDPTFNPKSFMEGARAAYEMIVMAYANGDRKTLKDLLSSEVYQGFSAAIADREGRGEVVKSTFVGIEKAVMEQAELKGSEAGITVRIISQMISATYDNNEKLIDGDAETVAEIRDRWTFSRDLRSRDPNWKLVATQSEH